MTSGQMDERRTIVLVEDLKQSPAQVWRVLTDPRLMSQWLMQNDFEPIIGHEFTFTGVPQPSVGFSGKVRCKVLELIAEKRLAVSWKDDARGGDAPWTVTWSLEQLGTGTRLTLVHDGFDPQSGQDQLSRRIMAGGWPSVLRRIAAAASAYVRDAL